MADHTVKAGDCFSSIAAENGFFNYRTVYDANGGLKAQRPNPNMLVPGDVVKVPAKKVKKVPVALDKEHPFVLDRRKTRMRVMVLDVEDKAPKSVSRKLDVGGKQTNKANDGLMEIDIDPKKKSGSAIVVLKPWKPGAPPKPKAAKSPAPYPPPIIPAEFEDKTPTPPAENIEFHWQLLPGALEPHTTDVGSLQRLFNLGVGQVLASTPDDITLAVKAYQRKNKLAAKGSESGKLSDIRGHLETAHDR